MDGDSEDSFIIIQYGSVQSSLLNSDSSQLEDTSLIASSIKNASLSMEASVSLKSITQPESLENCEIKCQTMDSVMQEEVQEMQTSITEESQCNEKSSSEETPNEVGKPTSKKKRTRRRKKSNKAVGLLENKSIKKCLSDSGKSTEQEVLQPVGTESLQSSESCHNKQEPTGETPNEDGKRKARRGKRGGRKHKKAVILTENEPTTTTESEQLLSNLTKAVDGRIPQIQSTLIEKLANEQTMAQETQISTGAKPKKSKRLRWRKKAARKEPTKNPFELSLINANKLTCSTNAVEERILENNFSLIRTLNSHNNTVQSKSTESVQFAPLVDQIQSAQQTSKDEHSVESGKFKQRLVAAEQQIRRLDQQLSSFEKNEIQQRLEEETEKLKKAVEAAEQRVQRVCQEKAAMEAELEEARKRHEIERAALLHIIQENQAQAKELLERMMKEKDEKLEEAVGSDSGELIRARGEQQQTRSEGMIIRVSIEKDSVKKEDQASRFFGATQNTASTILQQLGLAKSCIIAFVCFLILLIIYESILSAKRPVNISLW